MGVKGGREGEGGSKKGESDWEWREGGRKKGESDWEWREGGREGGRE